MLESGLYKDIKDNTKRKEKIEKVVSDANRALKQLFNQTENPFFKYKEYNQYKTKFELRIKGDNFKNTDDESLEDMDDSQLYKKGIYN